MRLASFARIAVVASMFISLGATGTTTDKRPDVVVVSGKLGREFLAKDVFRIGEFWIRVPADTEFNRWLSGGLKGEAVITLTTDPSKYADAPNTRILTGTLIHSTAPKPTPVENDVVGRLPDGNLMTVHVLFLKDELTGSLGPVTFETADFETVEKFRPHDSTTISIVIQIK